MCPGILWPPNHLASTFFDICSPFMLITFKSSSNNQQSSPSGKKAVFFVRFFFVILFSIFLVASIGFGWHALSFRLFHLSFSNDPYFLIFQIEITYLFLLSASISSEFKHVGN